MYLERYLIRLLEIKLRSLKNLFRAVLDVFWFTFHGRIENAGNFSFDPYLREMVYSLLVTVMAFCKEISDEWMRDGREMTRRLGAGGR